MEVDLKDIQFVSQVQVFAGGAKELINAREIVVIRYDDHNVDRNFMVINLLVEKLEARNFSFLNRLSLPKLDNRWWERNCFD